MHRRALSTLDHAGFEQSRFAAGVWHNLAQLYVGRKDTTAAEHALERCLSIRERVLGPGHPGRDRARPRPPLTVDVLELGGGR